MLHLDISNGKRKEFQTVRLEFIQFDERPHKITGRRVLQEMINIYNTQNLVKIKLIQLFVQAIW